MTAGRGTVVEGDDGETTMFHHHTATITPFSDNPDFDFEIRNILGQAVGGGADPGEVLAATAASRKNDHAGWFRAWQQLGQRTAEAADSRGSRRSPGQRGRGPSCAPPPTSVSPSTRSSS